MEEDFKPITSPNCRNPNCAEDDSYCFNCGAYLKNYCTNENCILNSGEQRTELESFMCYCPECGTETFFAKQHYIAPENFPDI